MTTPKRILVVEDEPLIAMLLEDFLEAIGCEVVGTADTVASALALIEQGGFDAVILDVNLRNGETSEAVAERLIRSGIPYAITSGDPCAGGAATAAPRLVKPYSMDQLEDVLGRMGRDMAEAA